MRKLSIVVPVYNEERWIVALLDRVLAADTSGLAKEIVVVDDCSTDGSAAILADYAARHPEVRVFRQEPNRGKGAALHRGFAEVTGEVVLIQDADLEYDPKEYPALLAPILDGRADVVFGSRFLGGAHRVLFYWHAVGNKALTMLSNMFTNLNLTDMETCYKVFRTEVIRGVTLEQERFGFEPEIVAKVAHSGARIFEVPISYSGRTYEEGKKIGWRDGVKALYCVLRYSRGR
jgi:glycosyltransferase involved in cell wall biosynthesis